MTQNQILSTPSVFRVIMLGLLCSVFLEGMGNGKFSSNLDSYEPIRRVIVAKDATHNDYDVATQEEIHRQQLLSEPYAQEVKASTTESQRPPVATGNQDNEATSHQNQISFNATGNRKGAAGNHNDGTTSQQKQGTSNGTDKKKDVVVNEIQVNPVVESTPPKKCWRSNCPSPRKNHIIVYMNNMYSAGWNDRMFIFSRLADLAGYLCADLHVPPPYLMLNKGHNMGERLPEDLRWSDFLNLSFGYNQTIQEWRKMEDLPTTTSLRVKSNSPVGNWEKLMQLENFTLAQTASPPSDLEDGFAWEIKTNLYQMELLKSKNPYEATHHRPESFPFGMPWRRQNGCKYNTFRQPSAYVSKAVTEVQRRVDHHTALNESITGIFHIRRGDAVAQCDTSLERITRFLDCSFAETQTIGNFTLLLSTDEDDSSYIDAVLAMPQTVESLSHVRIHWMDRIVRAATRMLIGNGSIPERLANNFFVFLVSQSIWKKASFALVQRRRSECPDCTSVRNILKKKGLLPP